MLYHENFYFLPGKTVISSSSPHETLNKSLWDINSCFHIVLPLFSALILTKMSGLDLFNSSTPQKHLVLQLGATMRYFVL